MQPGAHRLLVLGFTSEFCVAGHFRVPKTLTFFKLRPSAENFIWKQVLLGTRLSMNNLLYFLQVCTCRRINEWHIKWTDYFLLREDLSAPIWCIVIREFSDHWSWLGSLQRNELTMRFCKPSTVIKWKSFWWEKLKHFLTVHELAEQLSWIHEDWQIYM